MPLPGGHTWKEDSINGASCLAQQTLYLSCIPSQHSVLYSAVCLSLSKADVLIALNPTQGVMQARVKWGAQPPSVGLPFDWHLPPTKWDKQAPLRQAGGPPNSPAVSIPFSPSPESPYAALLPGFPHAHGLDADMEEQPRSVFPSPCLTETTWSHLLA